MLPPPSTTPEETPTRPTDRDAITEAISRLGATLDELQYPSAPRGRLPLADHVHREHRLIPALVTVDSFFRSVLHEHDATGACSWCDPGGRAPCWAHNLARTLLGGKVS